MGTTAPKRIDKARLRRESGAFVPEGGAEEDDQTGVPPDVDLVAVDHDVTPSQLRNLERALGTTVLDRAGVIIEIFHRHAKSREARLQVELARLAYTAPRLREAPGGKERQHFRGSGDSALELDRRRIRDRMAELKEQLAGISREQAVRRAKRREARRVTLVGYTNAGKSSLMRALTRSDAFVEDRLFATLDTSVRALFPPTHPRILISDTVGFIKKLPHDLVASFKSTLDEAAEASLILHVVDAADPEWEEQLAVTREVLREIGADTTETKIVFNKIDRVEAALQGDLSREHPDAWLTSAHDRDRVAELHRRIVEHFELSYVETEYLVPYTKQRLVSLMHESARVLEERYEEQGVVVRLRTDAETVGRLNSLCAADPESA
jgi:GTP-binding protein HflX